LRGNSASNPQTPKNKRGTLRSSRIGDNKQEQCGGNPISTMEKNAGAMWRKPNFNNGKECRRQCGGNPVSTMEKNAGGNAEETQFQQWKRVQEQCGGNPVSTMEKSAGKMLPLQHQKDP